MLRPRPAWQKPPQTLQHCRMVALQEPPEPLQHCQMAALAMPAPLKPERSVAARCLQQHSCRRLCRHTGLQGGGCCCWDCRLK